MSYFNDGIINKSYILEFYKNNPNIPEDVISFSLPPQNENIRQAQRINQTKTFGGVVFDDYGNDVVKISLSGTTVNSETRLIYTNRGSTINVNGSEEIFKINEIIQKYGKTENLEGKKIYLYSLDSKNSNSLCWQILIDSFTLKRSKDKPICFDYSLECTGFPVESFNKYEPKTTITQKSKLSNSSQTATQTSTEGTSDIEIINNRLEVLYKVLGKYVEFYEKYSNVKKAIKDYEKTIKLYESAITGFIDVTASYVQETKHLGETIINTAFRLTMGVALNVYNSASSLIESVKDLVIFCRNIPSSIQNTFSKYLKSYAETTDDINNNILIIVKQIDNSTNNIMAQAKRNAGVYDSVVIPGNENTNDKTQTVYGFENYIIRNGDTWSNLAANIYGDPNLGSLIASYNYNIPFETGNTIYIPKITQDTSYQLSEIYNTFDSKDNYGIDIKIGRTNDIELFNGDFQIVKGKNNLKQAIINRLSTDVNSRIRLVTYGIRARIGNASLVPSYIIASLKQTIAREPRIKSVEKIEFKGVGDKLYIMISYIDINNNHDIYGGLI